MARPLKVTVQNADGVDTENDAIVDDKVVNETPVVAPTIVKATVPKVRIIALKTVKSNIGGVPYEIEKGKPYEFTSLVAAVLCNAGAAART